MLALFASLATLLCCALPIIFVALGLGSAVAAITLKMPFLVALSSYHMWMFGCSAVLMGLGGWFIWNKKDCPSDPQLAAACNRADAWAKLFIVFAVIIWVTGMFFTYLLLPLRQWFSI